MSAWYVLYASSNFCTFRYMKVLYVISLKNLLLSDVLSDVGITDGVLLIPCNLCDDSKRTHVTYFTRVYSVAQCSICVNLPFEFWISACGAGGTINTHIIRIIPTWGFSIPVMTPKSIKISKIGFAAGYHQFSLLRSLCHWFCLALTTAMPHSPASRIGWWTDCGPCSKLLRGWHFP